MSIRKQKNKSLVSINNTPIYVLTSTPRITRSMSMKKLVTPTSKELFLAENENFDNSNDYITFNENNMNSSAVNITAFEKPRKCIELQFFIIIFVFSIK